MRRACEVARWHIFKYPGVPGQEKKKDECAEHHPTIFVGEYPGKDTV